MTTNQMIDAFEKRIKELLDKGYTPKQAVDMAYLEYPIMKTLQDEVKKLLHRMAEQGYGGVLAASVISKGFEMVWAPDKLTLSDRTTKGAKAVRDMVASVLHQQMLKNANYKANALALFDGYGYGGIIPEQDIPDFMRKLIKLSNGLNYDKQKYRNAMRQVERYIRQLNTQGMKYAYNKVLQAIESRNNEALFKAVHVATQERTRYFAERIARTERARAYIDGFLAKWQNDEDCVAYQWKLSTAHPTHDICDLYANADLYGLGKGIYPKDKVPTIPVHPHCMCRLKPIFKGQVPDEPSERIEEGGREYINTLTQRQKELLLGVKGSQLVKEGKAVWMDKARGFNRTILNGRIMPHKVIELNNIVVDGQIYEVDGKHVLLDHTPYERRIADILGEYFGTDIQLVPRINYPQSINTPDFMIGNEPYELKSPSGNGKNTVFDMINKHKKQSNRFIVSLDKTEMSVQSVELQINKVFTSNYTKNITEIILIDGGKVINVYKKEKDD